MIRLEAIGNLAKDAEVKEIQSLQNKAIQFSIAVNLKKDDPPIWVSCTKWVKPGGSTNVANYLKKGTQVFVSGLPKTFEHDGKAFQELVVFELKLLSK